MRIFADKLADHLNKQLVNIYLLFGNEPLLLQESRLAIQKKLSSMALKNATALLLIPI